ncbi:hypothetical protein [Salmonella phage vB_StyS-sam]|uniref:Uncharacterized protein n=1 Tax=Salmonella phage vB_StyS-sam TaxID=2664131 RepID=A0A5K7YBT8_9CAUD|nr:hypothetical protein QA026_gp39 [Salmonella phage vB_StyS-sam]BBO65992.1 hypothetical protein [Salmonella phage vB_StyS-sam]
MELAFSAARRLIDTRSGGNSQTVRPGRVTYLITSRVIASAFSLPSDSAAAALVSFCSCRCVFFASSACAFCCCCETRLARPSTHPLL